MYNNLVLKQKLNVYVLIAALICAVFFVSAHVTTAFAAKSDQTLYQEADVYYKKLKADKKLYQYRSNWETGINKYLTVYKLHGNSSLAPAALYRSGIMYLELYNFSKKTDDKTNGINNLKRVITEFSGNAYAKQAEDVLIKNGVTDIPKPAVKVLGPKKDKPATFVNANIAGAANVDTGPSGALREDLATFAPNGATPVVETLSAANTAPAVTAASVSEATSKARECYAAGEDIYTKLTTDRDFRLTRQNWNNCLDTFDKAYQTDKKGPWAAAALYARAMVYKDMYHFYGSSDYLQESKKALQLIVRDYPKSSYADKARQFDASNGFQAFSGPSLITGEPNPDSPPEPQVAATANAAAQNNAPASTVQTQANAQNATAQIQTASQTTGSRATLSSGQPVTVTPTVQSSGKVTVTEVRHWSNPQYTRVVIGLSGPTVYKYHLLLEDKTNNLPPRLYVDVEKSELSQDVNRAQPINDDLLRSARAGQYTKDDVRVVLDLKSFGSYKIFPLNDPFRIVIDIWADKNGATQASVAAPPAVADTPAGSATVTQTQGGVPVKTPQTATPSNNMQTPPVAQSDGGRVTVITPPRDGSIGTADLAKQLGLSVKRIVIDPGHGGKDGGAPGAVKGIVEKAIVLQISLKLKAKIEKNLGCEVIMTRSTDVYLSLEERMAIANSRNADLFISIHTNAARNASAYGVETYFLNLATDEESIRVAAMENATSTRGISDLQNILNDLMQNSKINESSKLAKLVQNNLVGTLKKTYGGQIKDKGVKQAPFYVLLGATMPSILVETGFLSNGTECKRLMDSAYQDRVCDGIVAGIRAYMKELQP